MMTAHKSLYDAVRTPNHHKNHQPAISAGCDIRTETIHIDTSVATHNFVNTSPYLPQQHPSIYVAPDS